MATHTQHLHTASAQRADIGGSLPATQTAGPKARLDAHYQRVTNEVVPKVWNALGAVATVGLLALFVAMFAGDWRLSVAHSLVGVLAFGAVVMQVLHLRRDRALTQERDATRSMAATLDVMDGSRPAPRGHSRMFK